MKLNKWPDKKDNDMYDWIQRGHILASEDKKDPNIILSQYDGRLLKMYVEKQLIGQALVDAIELFGPRKK